MESKAFTLLYGDMTMDTASLNAEGPPAACKGCWICGLMTSKKFWLSFVGAFIVVAVFEWFWHMDVMAKDYHDTAVMWRPMAEMKPSLFYLSYLIKAYAYTYLVLATLHTGCWVDAIASG